MLVACLTLSIVGLSRPTEAEVPYPVDIANWSESTKSAQRSAGNAILAKIQDAADRGLKSLSIPKGDYRFNTAQGNRGAHIVLKGAHGLTIDFQGSTLWFETESTGIQMRGCSDVNVKNVTLDWDPLPFIQGTVTNMEGNAFFVRLDAGYDRVLPGMKEGGGNWRGFVFTDSDREFKPGQTNFNVNFDWENGPNGTYKVKYRGFRGQKLDDSQISRGDKVVLLKRMGRAVRLEGCSSCVLNGVTLYSSPFISFSDANGDGNTYRDCHVLRRPGTNRLIAGNADGINASDGARGPLIESCQLEFLGDDFVNIHGHFGRVLEQTSPTELITTKVGNRTEIHSPAELQFYDRKTMKLIGTRKGTATSVDYQPSRSRLLTDLDDKVHSGEAAKLDKGEESPDTQCSKVTLDQPITITGDTVIIAEAYSSANAVIRNSSFHGNVARGIRLQSPGAHIEGNNFSRIAGPAITMMGSGNYWGEGPYVHSAEVTGNTFTDTCMFAPNGLDPAAIVIQEEGDFRSKRLSRDIKIISNTFTRTGGAAIIARGVDDLTITGNKVTQDHNRKEASENTTSASGSAIVAESVNRLTMKDNQVASRGSFSSGPPILSNEVK